MSDIYSVGLLKGILAEYLNRQRMFICRGAKNMKVKYLGSKLKGFFRPVNVITIWLSAIVVILVAQNLAYSHNRQFPQLSSSTQLKLNQEQSDPADQITNEIQSDDIFAGLADSANAVSIKDIDFDSIKKADSDEKKWVTMRMRVTSYCTCRICCGKFSDGKTADGHRIKWGDRFVAAPKNIPFGTEMIIPGYNHGNPVKVKDRGRVIRGNRLDVFYNTHHTAGKWGVKYLDVKVKM